MNKMATIIVLLFSIFITSNAKDITGEGLYDAKCKACHMLNVPKGMRDANHTKMMNDMKAPPMAKISSKIKNSFDGNESKAIAFVAEYIVNPDANKSLCMPKAIKAFGVMPPIKAMSKEEVAVISKWLITNFQDTWKVTKRGETCLSKVKKCDKPNCKSKCCNDKNASKKCDKPNCKSKCCDDKNTLKKCDKPNCKSKCCNDENTSKKCDKPNCKSKFGNDENTSKKCASGKCGTDK